MAVESPQISVPRPSLAFRPRAHPGPVRVRTPRAPMNRPPFPPTPPTQLNPGQGPPVRAPGSVLPLQPRRRPSPRPRTHPHNDRPPSSRDHYLYLTIDGRCT